VTIILEPNLANVTQGLAGENGAYPRAPLGRRRKRLPILGSDNASGNGQ
jgi:hypothetical protein